VKTIIYVDASFIEQRHQIGLYDQKNKKGYTVCLSKNVTDITLAEQYAILYGLLYAYKKHLPKVIVMSDCRNALKDNALNTLAKNLGMTIMWIPREINIADAISRKEPNRKKKVWKQLKLIMRFINQKSPLVSNVPVKKLITISKKSQAVIRHLQQHSLEFPQPIVDFSKVIQEATKLGGIQLKKGDVMKIRKELLKHGLIVVDDSLITVWKEERAKLFVVTN
jgi:hypothetical protein